MSIARGTPTLRRNLKSLRDLESDALWSKVLRYQVAFYRGQDLALFHNLEAWQNASRVLDVGCGNGDFLKSLCDRYPDKMYVAIDHSYDALQHARKRLKSNAVRIFQDDIYNFDLGLEKVDFIILRFVAQYLPDIPLLMRKLRSLLRPGGSILIIESNDDMAGMIPHTPEFERLFRHLRRARDIRHNPCKELRIAGERYGFRRIHDQDVPVTAVHGSDKRRFQQFIFNLSELVNREFNGRVDQVKIYRQLKSWMQDPQAYAQVGLNYLVMQKVDSKKEHGQWHQIHERAKIFKKLGKRRMTKLFSYQIEYLVHERRQLSAAYCLLESAHRLGLTRRLQQQLQESTWLALRGFAAVPTFRLPKAELLRLQYRELYQICKQNGWHLPSPRPSRFKRILKARSR